MLRLLSFAEEKGSNFELHVKVRAIEGMGDTLSGSCADGGGGKAEDHEEEQEDPAVSPYVFRGAHDQKTDDGGSACRSSVLKPRRIGFPKGDVGGIMPQEDQKEEEEQDESCYAQRGYDTKIKIGGSRFL